MKPTDGMVTLQLGGGKHDLAQVLVQAVWRVGEELRHVCWYDGDIVLDRELVKLLGHLAITARFANNPGKNKARMLIGYVDMLQSRAFAERAIARLDST